MPTSQLTIDVRLRPDERREILLADARQGLTSTPKVLSPLWFYDEHGSGLFDAITRLPEYYPTRAERALLEAHADEIASLASADTLVELGSGTSDKTRLLLDAMRREGSLRRYSPLDVSEETLRDAAEQLADEYPGLDVHGVVGDFHTHLHALPNGSARRLVAFLGSTIGNLNPAERRRFLFDLDCSLVHTDRFLLGVDLVKDAARLLAAYDDGQGLTAEFNRNAVRVLGRELGAEIDPELFEHVAVWDEQQQWIEMRLRAVADQVVPIEQLGITVRFEQGEELRTEISAKFTAGGITDELYESGLVVEQTWQDTDYLLVLARPYC